MLNHNLRKNFAPSPLDYIQGKIEQARQGLQATSQIPANKHLEVPRDKAVQNGRRSSLLEDIEEDADNDLSSDADDNSALFVPASPLLPLDNKESSKRELSPAARFLSLVAQPISLLLLTTLLYFGSSSATLILARFNLYQATYKFPFPLTISFFHLVFAEAVLLLWSALSHILIQICPNWKPFIITPGRLAWDLKIMKKLFPVSFSFFAGYAALISCLEYMPMSYAVLFLSPTILIQMACNKYYSPECTQSIYVASSCILLMLGHVLSAVTFSSPGLPGMNIQGVLTGLLASIALPIHNCLFKKVLVSKEHNLAQLLHNIFVSSICLTFPLMVVSGEIFEISAHCYFLDEKGFWLMMLLLCVVSVLANFCQSVLLMFTTPLTLVVLCYTKTTLVQLPISLAINQSPLEYLNLLGGLISLIGVCCYFYLINHHRPKFGLRWDT